ncbi:putative coiled-coil domain-containing protein 13 isoform X1 [Trypanosoma rangeli]|uniref:Putative coiled-coil domain-containing protein 13 isoform X1 n=1 Tax=Trypanosoma rangeli TaxID=5698 RepID=A0A3R7NQZ1_TRYRA|nr:putative coiled-coil domain-containing protein 13 isoform X1 [Trypanosoma rangeli]RNF06370.1 putative coiled-coil domain-containing protein 13 isoform X1 [Trypanosoma rangeli]|eukprot:RNF06370.1 putative coiled-coil domain-containing protein 13 isoform X1 [Trypanosoma rangeli]
MPNSVVSSNSGGGPHKEDIAQLSALFAEGGFDKDALEGRYLNQLRRARQLGVQLEAEKTHSRRLAAELAALQAKMQDVNSGRDGETSKRRVRQAGGSEQGEEQQSTMAALKERLERAYIQLNESKLQTEEHKKESQRLRKLLLQEIGGTPQELETLLKSTAETGGGWRGRAQQIVLLKGKVKELERTLAATAATVSASANSDDDSSGVGNGGAAVAASAAALVRGRAGGASVVTDTATALTSRNRDLDDVARERVAELQGRRFLQLREVQDELYKRTAELETQKRRAEAAQARHVNLEADNRTLREYLQTVLTKTENDNLLIDAYKEELAGLQQRLHAARMQLQEWEAWEGGEPPKGRGEEAPKHRERRTNNPCHLREERLDADTAVALAGADAAIEINRLRMENEELRVRLIRCGNHDDSRHCGGSSSRTSSRSPASPSSGDKLHGRNDDTALVLHWLRTVAPMPPTAQGHGSAWQSRVAEVLRRAHAAVCFVEQQHEEDGNRLSRCYETIKQLQEEPKRRNGRQAKRGSKPHEGGDDEEEDGGAAMMADLVLQENRALKKRLKMLQALMEKERMAYESLRFAPSGAMLGDATTTTTTTNNTTTTTNTNGDDAASAGLIGGTQVTAAAHEQLKAQYEELRCAFNSLQKERLRRGGV